MGHDLHDRPAPSGRERVAAALAAVAVFCSLLGFAASGAGAVHGSPPGLFELEGDALDNPAGGKQDWDAVDFGDGQSVFVPDASTGPNSDDIFTEGTKDIHDISEWCWKLGNEPDKDGITNAYAAFRSAGDGTYLYVGADRYAQNGAAQIGFWLLKDDVQAAATQGNCPNRAFEFTGSHQDGDILILSDFTNGGMVSDVSLYRWQAGAAVLITNNGKDCTDPTISPTDFGCATVNDGPTPAPWAANDPVPGASQYVPKSGPAGTFPAGAFFEGGVDLTHYFSELGCFSTFVSETRSSHRIDADLKDLAFGKFQNCKLTVDKSGDERSKVGDPAHYTVTISNDGLVPLYKQSIVDDVLGDLTDGTNQYVVSSTCGASLAAGASCTITLDYTVQAGDPDPLVNTVTATYDTNIALSGDDVVGTDQHSLELFQPSVDVVKTGDQLAQVGDTADYTITVTNTSSADSPDLVNGTIVDSLLGNLLDPANPFVTSSTCGATLPTGTGCEVTASRVVQAGDPDPLPNTVTVHYNPQGFPNDITDSDDHAVNLFTPGVSVTKVCDELGKVTDPVRCTVTVTDTSSADSPPLTDGEVSDTLVGDLLDEAGWPAHAELVSRDCGPTLAVGASCTVVYDYRVQGGDPDPLPNTVTVSYHPVGFPNVVTAEASSETNLFQPGVVVSKSGDALGKVGDPADYTITVTNTSSGDSPALVNGTIVDTLLGDLLDPANPYVTSSDCGATLAVGASCTIEATRTVQAGDADPLPNTVTVHYNPSGFPNDITASDDHSVNLFQPSVDVDKTGDALSKVGDPVSYTVTVTNTSSSDSPDLVGGSIVDSLAGDLLDPANTLVTANTCGTGLAAGASCTIQYTITVPAGAPDPLPNTVSVHYNPAGFPNDISDGDGHSVNLFQPSVEVDKSGPAQSKVGDPTEYTVVVTNTSSPDSPALVDGTIADTLVGDLLDAGNAAVTGSSCGTTLATGASCTITYTYTPQAGDPDPLVNSVVVHYHPDGFPNDITDADSHTVGLFQPSVELDKSGDALSKVGDPASYTVTVTNTSSSDTPTLVNGVLTDSLAGNLLDPANPAVTVSDCGTTLGVGESCTVQYTIVVPADAPDPLPNIATVHYNPFGFPNDITDSDDHSVNLFQPSVRVAKDCDGLSKVGDPVRCEITVTNTSSADSPDLVNGSVTDSLVGDLLDPGSWPAHVESVSGDCAATLPTGESCSIAYDYTVQAGDPDPLPNTVTATYNPDGFPNVITGSARDDVNLFQPSVTVAKVCDGLSKVGDPVDCTVTLTNTSSADSPDLVDGTIVDSITGDLLDEDNASVTSSDCDDTLAAGEACTVAYTFTVPAAASDPLTNTVTVHYNPAGFPNDITAQSSWDVNLFQPSVTVDKDGDAFGKVGDPVDYTITVTNTSSEDSPALVNGTIVDSLLGDLLDPANPYVTASDCDGTLAIGASCTVTASRTVLESDPDPLPNTVTVHFNPDGFPNDITDSDDHAVNLFRPGVVVVKSGDTLGKVTDPADYLFVVMNTSSEDSPDLVNGTIVDSLLGDLLDPANPYVTASDCTATLAVGTSCSIEATRTVQAGDADPLPNTVTVTYNPEGYPNEITASDDHAVNLFQPSVSVEKTGDALARVGSDAGYTITVTNTSSADSPELVNGSIVDSLLGDLLDPENPYVTSSDCDGTLAVGENCTIEATRTVLASDPDPLPNTVTVHFNPDGFPNDITGAASWDVNLFQPSVSVDKTGDTLGKVTDPADYTFTVTNTSSEDSPALVDGSIVDSLLGDLLDAENPYVTASDCDGTLAVGASCTITATRVVEAGDPDPLPNTVTVHFSSDGFADDVAATDDHAVNLFQPSVEVDKSGDTSAEVGEDVDYTFTVTNTSSEDSPALVNGSIVDSLLGDLLDPENPYVTASDCDGTLAVGASCTIEATRTVLDSDPDPLPNTVTVHFNPDGFPNDITDSDDHSVDIEEVTVTTAGPTVPPTAPPTTTGGNLPFTGSGGGLLALGWLCFVGGSVTVLLFRRRRAGHAL